MDKVEPRKPKREKIKINDDTIIEDKGNGPKIYLFFNK